MKKLIFALVLIATVVFAADWPQWRGIHRDGISPETNLLKSWPENGPDMLWSFDELGPGNSSPAIENNLVYITGDVDKQETLFKFDENGKLLWQTTYGARWKNSFPEVRTTPTIDGDNLYVISGMGVVACIDKNSGDIKWSVDTVEKFNGEFHRWGISEAPLIIDDKIIASPGGPDASIVALDKKTGETIWSSKGLSDMSSYCSPICVERGGKKIIITMLENHVVGVDAASGTVLWKDAFADYFGDDTKAINPNTPIYKDGMFYTTSGYDDGSAMYKISADGLKLERLWVDRTLDVHMGHVVLVDGYIYGANWLNNRDGNWVCLDWQTGKVMYEQEWMTKGAIIAANGLLYCYNEKGTVALVKADSAKFDIISSFEVPKGSGQHWPHPAISNGRLYIRHGNSLMVYDIKAN